MSLKNNVNGLLSMINEGKMLDAFEKYYAEDVVMQENSEEPRVGKVVNREFEKQFLASIVEMHTGSIDNVAFDEDKQVAMIQSSMDVTFKEFGRMKMEEVSVQQWKDGQIVHERFFYNRG